MYLKIFIINNMDDNKILLKFKDNESHLEPYIKKVIECLHKTDINHELIISLEKEIRFKTLKDVEKLYEQNNFKYYKETYITNARHIIDNLKSSNSISNIELIEKINSGVITVQQLVYLNREDMHEKRWKFYIEKKQREIEKITNDPESTTSLFVCSRCHRNKCTYFERQDRSSDEPKTVHITCCYCGKKWRN
jgi:transcription elongation factor S-II